MKKIFVPLFVAGSCFAGGDLGPNPSMRPVIHPEDRARSYKKSEFITKYNELVDTKETKKILSSKTPLKLVSHDMLNKLKLAANLLLSDVNADASFELKTSERSGKTLVELATELRNQIAKLYEQATIIIDQYPIASYKKPLFKSKPRYDENERDNARKKINATVTTLQTVRLDTNAIRISINQIPTTKLTEGQKRVYALATHFADQIEKLANKLVLAVENIE